MILLAFRHGLRAAELCSLRWEQIDLVHARLHVSRAKNGIPSVHPLTGTELRARAGLFLRFGYQITRFGSPVFETARAIHALA
jgi:integrase